MRRIVFLLLSLVGASVLVASSAQALSSDPKLFISADNTFYAYVKSGESISAAFEKVDFPEPFNTVRGDVAVTLEGPDSERRECVMKFNVAVGKGCSFLPQTAEKSGIWRIHFAAPENAKTYKEVSPVVKWGGNWFKWTIEVTNTDGEEKPGRVWTERYAIRQPEAASYVGDFMYFYISEDGYIYKGTQKGYNGQISTLSADSIGIRRGTTCVSAYQSVDVSDKNFSPALGTCGNAYKLFFEEPAGDLPTKAVRWDDSEDWVRPNISRPSVSELHFAHDNSNDQLSGTVSFFLHNFIGQYEINIDVDNDGSFNGHSDVTLHQQMKKLSNGLQRVRFDGVDRQGQILPPSSTIGIRVDITKVAEIHLVAADVEGRQGGLELVRLSGDNAPTTRLCWNDTELPLLASATLNTKEVDGKACPDSTGGVHAWVYADGSWGNARYIDDWIYAQAKLTGKNQITYPEASIKQTANMDRNWLIISAIGIMLVIGFVAGTVFYMKRRAAKKSALAQTPPRSQPFPPQAPADQQPPSDQDPNRY